MSKNNWTEDQLKAIKKRESNILVSASAGSGKTAVLVERIIQKVLDEYLDVDKILVVTFTNAAAQELKEKILNAIYRALETEKDHKKVNHLKNQLIYINRASITTIDAFCFKLVRENFVHVKVKEPTDGSQYRYNYEYFMSFDAAIVTQANYGIQSVTQ